MRLDHYEAIARDGQYICLDCAAAAGQPECAEDAPLFASAECDSIPSCGICGCLFTYVSLTSDGVDYLIDAYIRYRANNQDLPAAAAGAGSSVTGYWQAAREMLAACGVDLDMAADDTEAERIYERGSDPARGAALTYMGQEYTYGDLSDSVIDLPCGCSVEPDGICPCGNMSPLLAMGLI